MAKQLDKDSRKILADNLNKRIENAEIELKKLTHYTSDEKAEGYDPEKAGKPIPLKEISAKAEKQIGYLQTRMKELQLSLRLVWNTNWIIEQREIDIKETANVIKESYGPGTEMDEDKRKLEAALIKRLNAMTKAQKCQRKGCYTGRGFIGVNVMKGEFMLCKCAYDTIDYFKLHD